MRPVTSLPSVREIATVIFRHKKSILGALIAPPLALIAMAFLVTPIYEAETRVLVKPAREFIPRYDGAVASLSAPQTSMREIVDTVMQTVTSIDLLKDVLRMTGTGKLYPALAAAHSDPEVLEDKALRALHKDLTVWPIRLTNIIEIRLRNSDRALAVAALQAALTRFEERHVEAYSNARTQFLDYEIQNNLRLIAEAQAERTDYINSRSLFNVDEQRSLTVQQRIRLGQDLRDASIRFRSLENQIAFLKQEIAAQPDTILLQTTLQNSEAGVAATRRLHDLRERLGETLATLGPGHPTTRAARAALASAEQAMKQIDTQARVVATGVNPVQTTLRTQLATTEAEYAPLAGRIEALEALIRTDEARLRQISTDEVHLKSLNIRIAELEAANATLQQRLSDARVSEDLDRAKVAGLSVIQTPTALGKPVSPQKVLYAAGGLALGMVSCGFVVLMVLTFGNRFIAAESIERILGVPVLVSLPDMPALRKEVRLAAQPERIADGM